MITLKRLKKFTSILAKNREGYRTLNEKLEVRRAKFLKKNEELIKKWDDAKRHMEMADTNLRSLTLQAFEESGNKNPAPGLTVRDHKEVVYGTDENVLAWCLSHKLFIKVDQSALRKFVLATPDQIPTEIAWINDESYTVAISSSLAT